MKDKIIFKTLMLKGDAGEPTDQQTQTAVDKYMQDHPEAAIDEAIINSAVSDWLDDHPEATTTVDYSITTKVFNNVSQMVSDLTLEEGDKVVTTGFYALNDDGGALYIIKASADRACSIELNNGLYAVLVGDTFNTRQIGLKNGDNGQITINDFIADTTFSCLKIIDEIHVQKTSTASTIDVVELIKIERDNFTIIFENGGKLVLDTNNSDFYRILNIKADNIQIFNPVIVGDADTIGLTTGEYGHGLYLNGCENVTVYNGNIGKCFGDAVGIIGNCKNISFLGTLYCYDCGRQGMSVIEAHGLYVEKIIGVNIKRTDPSCVVDCEPNNASQTIEAEFGTIYGIDCKRGFNALAHGSKIINIQNLITEHNDANYDSDFGVAGTTDFENEDPYIYVHCKNIIVRNSKKTCIALANMNENLAVLIDNVTIQGSERSTANVVNEATIRIKPKVNSIVRNIKINSVNVINDISPVDYWGIVSSGYPACTFENCYIDFHSDNTAVSIVTSLRNAQLINTQVKADRQPTKWYILNSSDEIYVLTKETVFQLEGLASNLYVVLIGLNFFKLYKTNLSAYTSNTASYINETSALWEITGVNICSVVFDHTNKTITFTKIA